MTDLVKKWEQVGLLEGIDDNDKPLLAYYLDTMSNHCVSNSIEGNIDDDNINVWILPVIRRVYNHVKIFDIFDLKAKLVDYVKNGEMKGHIHQFSIYQGVDVECECIGLFSQKYVKEILDSSKPLA